MQIDIDRLLQRSARLDLAGIDFGAFADQPLDDQTLRCLRYMHDVEHHTVCYLRDILVTRAHRDPETTAFLSMWAYEEYWHGDALGRVLRAHGEPAGPARIARVRGRVARSEAVAPWLHAAASALLGPTITAVQLTWGAVNEWTTQAGYARLAARSGHPVLAELLGRIMKQEGRHIDFYASRAAALLDRDARARRITRFALRRFWGPVGSDVMPDAEVAFVVTHLFGGADGRSVAERIDRRVDRLPGLAGLRLVAGELDRVDPSSRASGAPITRPQLRAAA